MEEQFFEVRGNNRDDLVRVIGQDVSTTYKIYIDADVEQPHNYREVINTLITAGENDTVVLDINTYGGDLYSTIAIVNAVRDCQGYTVAEVTQASSAGSFIALACDTCVPMPHSDFFIHETQFSTRGSLSTQENTIMFMKKKQEAFFRDVYEGFLTESEIDDLLKGKSKEGIYIDWEEAITRLEYREEYFKEKYEAQQSQTPNTAEVIGLKEDELVLKNFYEEYKNAKDFSIETIDSINKGKFNIEDLTLSEIIEIEFYLNYCNRELIEVEEMILERLDYLRDKRDGVPDEE